MCGGMKTPNGDLTLKQQLFVDEFVKDWNASDAARRAGYSTRAAAAIGNENLTKPSIAAAILSKFTEIAHRNGVTQDRIVQELALVGFARMGDYAEWGPDGVTLKSSKELSDQQLRVVSEVSETTTKDGGTIRFKLHDKLQALFNLGKHLGMFPDKVQHSGPDGGPIMLTMADLVKVAAQEENGHSGTSLTDGLPLQG